MKKLILLISFIIFTIVFPSTVSAQGTYTCILMGSCDVQSNNCDDGFQALCTDPCESGPHQCIPSPLSPLEPKCADGKSINTALGCIPYDPQELVNTIFPWALGIAGTAALLLIIYGGFSYVTAAGNPEKIQHARELVTSAIIGLLIVIFSIVIMQIIGVDILGIKELESSSTSTGGGSRGGSSTIK